MDKNQFFEEIYHEYYPSIYHFINCRVCNPACAEDIANDVFLAAYCNLHSYDASKGFITTWLYAIASNRLKNYYKKRQRLEGSFEYYMDEPIVSNDAKGVGPLVLAYIETLYRDEYQLHTF